MGRGSDKHPGKSIYKDVTYEDKINMGYTFR